MSNLLGKRTDTPETISDGGLSNTVRVNGKGELMVEVSGSIGVDGGATEAKQDDQIDQLADIVTAIENIEDRTVEPYEVQPGIFALPVISAGGEIEAKQSGTWDVSVNNPITGYATDTTLQSVNGHVDQIEQKVATANNQTTQITYLTAIANDGAKDTSVAQGNASLSSIDGKVALESTSQAILAKLSSLGPWIDRAIVNVPTEPSAAQQLPSYACSELKVIADRGNTQPVYFGGSGVSSTTSQDLEARDVEIIGQITNSNVFYVIAASGHTGQKVRIQTR